MHLQAFYKNDDKKILAEIVVFSVGGGSIEIFGTEELIKVPITYKDVVTLQDIKTLDYFYSPLK